MKYTSGGGGGCIARDSEILLADGVSTKKVQFIKQGDWIMGYNLTSGQLTPVQVIDNIKSKVSSILNINNGLLKTTLVHQPIYMKNDTYVGWLQNPINLKIGEYIFNAVRDSWIQINQLDVIEGKVFKVYEVLVTPLNTIIANEILLDPFKM